MPDAMLSDRIVRSGRPKADEAVDAAGRSLTERYAIQQQNSAVRCPAQLSKPSKAIGGPVRHGERVRREPWGNLKL